MKTLKIIFLSLATGSSLLAVICIAFGILGLIGILADVSPAENKEFGIQFLSYSIPFIATSLISALLAFKFFKPTN